MADPWKDLAPDYAKLIQDQGRDSEYLRSVGILPNVVRLIEDWDGRDALDAGCGTGWLRSVAFDDNPLRQLVIGTPRRLALCDIAEYPGLPDFSVQDIRHLTYADESFDIAVASMTLMWVEDLDKALRSLHRVLRPGGWLIVSIPHPVSYRTGTVQPDGSALVTDVVGRARRIDDLWINDTIGPLSFFHRPIMDYVNALDDAGFYVRKMLEWTLDLEAFARSFRGERVRARTDRLPMFAFLKAQKR